MMHKARVIGAVRLKVLSAAQTGIGHPVAPDKTGASVDTESAHESVVKNYRFIT
jgi:hypothetical protein